MPLPNPPFSQRHGFIGHAKDIVIWENAPKNLRYCLLETVRELGWAPSILREIVCRALREPADKNNWTEFPNVWNEVQSLVYGCEWFKVYDIIEAFHARFQENDEETEFERAECEIESYALRFTDELNSFFLEKGIGWHLVEGKIVARGNETFEATVNTAVTELEEDEKPSAAGHLRFATGALSIRPKANTSGAVSHATSAVECVLGQMVEGVTLGDYLKKPGLFRPTLKKGLEGIWGYASDVARHGKEGIEPTREEAEFVIATCAAICTFLIKRTPE